MDYKQQLSNSPHLWQLIGLSSLVVVLSLLLFVGTIPAKINKPSYIPNNNPGNIKKGAFWLGEAPTCKSKKFVCFTTSEWGVRALGVVLYNYYVIHRIDTIREIITRYAPISENNTKAYILFVSHSLGVPANKPLNMKNPMVLASLMHAIITYEQGHDPFSFFNTLYPTAQSILTSVCL